MTTGEEFLIAKFDREGDNPVIFVAPVPPGAPAGVALTRIPTEGTTA
jgi:hypothetical protein